MEEEEHGEICFVPSERSVERGVIARGTCGAAVVVFNDVLASYLFIMYAVIGGWS